MHSLDASALPAGRSFAAQTLRCEETPSR